MAAKATQTGNSRFPRSDLIASMAVGLGVALVFGAPLLVAIEAFWYGTALPAFSTLAESGIGWCG